MIGPHNHSAPYMGSLSGLSWKLAHFIFDTDRDFTVMYGLHSISQYFLPHREAPRLQLALRRVALSSLLTEFSRQFLCVQVQRERNF